MLEMEPSVLTVLILSARIIVLGVVTQSCLKSAPRRRFPQPCHSVPEFAECMLFFETYILCYSWNSCNFVSVDLYIWVMCGDPAVVKDVSPGIHTWAWRKPCLISDNTYVIVFQLQCFLRTPGRRRLWVYLAKPLSAVLFVTGLQQQPQNWFSPGELW